MSLAAAVALLFFVELYLVWVYVTVCADKNKFVACIEVFRFVSYRFILCCRFQIVQQQLQLKQTCLVSMISTYKWLCPKQVNDSHLLLFAKHPKTITTTATQQLWQPQRIYAAATLVAFLFLVSNMEFREIARLWLLLFLLLLLLSLFVQYIYRQESQNL